jgi:hypothetical protein
MIISTIMEREVTQARITGLSEEKARMGKACALRDTNNSLDDWQHDTAVERWSGEPISLNCNGDRTNLSHAVMRQVMPYNVWEIYQ